MKRSGQTLISTLLSSLALVLALAGSASALPPNFMGLHFSTLTSAPQDWEVIKRSGAKTYRLNATWDVVNDAGVALGGDWKTEGAWQQTYDKLVEQAALKDIALLPVFYGRKTDAAVHQFYLSTETSNWNEWHQFVWTFVQRYGRGGTFWDAHPSLNYKPVLIWEVWNEPNLAENNPGESILPQKYAEFLISTANTIKNAQNAVRNGGEPVDTQILHAGILQENGMDIYEFMEKSSKVSGYAASFEGLSIHPYSFQGNEAAKLQGVKTKVGAARVSLDTFGSSAKTLWITELGWPISGAGAPLVSEAEQASLLNQTWNWLKQIQSTYKLELAMWYFYRDHDNVNHWAYHTGLRRGNGEFRPAWFAFQQQTGVTRWPRPYSSPDDNAPGPHLVKRDDGSIDVFFRTPSGGLGHNWMATNGEWHTSDVLPGSLAANSVPHPVVQPDGDIDVFWRTPSGGLGHNFWTPNTGWVAQNLSGSLASEPHPVVRDNGRIDVFYRTPSGTVGHNFFVNGWGNDTLPGSSSVAGDPYPVLKPDGDIDVFWRTSSGGLGHTFMVPNGTWASAGTLPGSLASNADPRAVVKTNGEMDVFWRTPSGGLGHNFWTPSTGWVSQDLSGSLASDSEPRPVAHDDFNIDVFWKTPANEIGHSRNGPWGGGFNPEVLLSGVQAASDPYPLLIDGGRMDLFWRTPSAGLGHAFFLPLSGWSNSPLPGSLDPKAVPQFGGIVPDGRMDVLYRTPNGQLGHNYFHPAFSWQSDTLSGSVALEAPTASTKAATGVSSSEATVNGTVNPEGSSTNYYFEYGPTTAYGTKKPTSPGSAGSGTSPVNVSQTLTGLAPGTTYHVRVVAESPLGGTTYGADETFATSGSSKSAQVPVTEPFDGSAPSIANFNSNWSALGWAAGGTPKGTNTSTGWAAVSSHPTINGASYNHATLDIAAEKVAIATLGTSPGVAQRYFSLLIDMPTATTTRAGYELKFEYLSTDTYKVTLLKWQSGSSSELTSQASYNFPVGSSLALADSGGTVSAWTNTGAGFNQLLSATDSTFNEGTAGILAAGSNTKLTNFKVTPTIYQLVGKHSSRCIDIEGGSSNPGAAIQIWDCSGAANQHFYLDPISPPHYQVRPKHSGQCLDVTSASMSAGTKLQQYPCQGTAQTNQLWKLEPMGSGYYQLKAKHSGQCADVIGVSKELGTKLQQYTCLGAGAENQLWKPVAVG